MKIQALVSLNVPYAILPLLLRLAKTLLRDTPETESKAVAKAQARLEAEVARIEAAIDQRRRSQNPKLLAKELEFDRALDALWRLFRLTVGQRAVAYAHPGLDFLSPERQAEVDLDELRAQAEAATAVHEALFEPDGTGFTKERMAVQVETMASLLRMIESDGHDEAIAATLGGKFVKLLEVCQAEYEGLVHVRMRREAGVSEDFRTLSADLRWRMDRYKVALESLYDEDEPESLDLVLDALRSLILTTKALSRASSSAEALDGELDEVLVELDIDFDDGGQDEAQLAMEG